MWHCTCLYNYIHNYNSKFKKGYYSVNGSNIYNYDICTQNAWTRCSVNKCIKHEMHSPVMLRLVDHFWIFNSMIQTARHKAIYRFFTVKSFYKSKTYLQQKHRWRTVMVTVKIYKVENNLDKKKRLFSCILSLNHAIKDSEMIHQA
jgi:hypothetical protein